MTSNNHILKSIVNNVVKPEFIRRGRRTCCRHEENKRKSSSSNGNTYAESYSKGKQKGNGKNQQALSN